MTMPALPDDVEVYKRTPTFTEHTVPAGLLRAHTTREGTWGRVVVESGRLRYRILGEPGVEVILTPGHPGVVRPAEPHEVEPLGPVRFHVEFLRRAEAVSSPSDQEDVMALAWIREPAAVWDAEKAAVIGGAPEGALPALPRVEGALLPGDWWRAERGGEVVGYGWMDTVWGDGEVLVAVAPGAQRQGVGAFVLGQLAAEAAARGLRYVFNVVRPTHPRREEVTAWLIGLGYTHAHDDERLVKKVG